MSTDDEKYNQQLKQEISQLELDRERLCAELDQLESDRDRLELQLEELRNDIQSSNITAQSKTEVECCERRTPTTTYLPNTDLLEKRTQLEEEIETKKAAWDKEWEEMELEKETERVKHKVYLQKMEEERNKLQKKKKKKKTLR
eukprot:NODE_10605_length_504_cov_13.519685_g9955_i0.p1 GENE.NODE_10605_length_504_cov_13.519685_g9955_i0~~NODE_10605_length_504_cov_13.519685_g9955_i0.p1  ORF type:complete len:144 (-),score=30.28 NODE_10605_length_504_cov_13.519685_g9955_i0:4-435(-)